MKILKPNIAKMAFCIVIMAGIYLYFSTLPLGFIECLPGHENSCHAWAIQEKHKSDALTTLAVGLPVAIVGYLFVGFVQSKKKKI